MKKTLLLLFCVAISVFLVSCSSTKKVASAPPPVVQPNVPKFDFVPPTKANIASAGMTIAIVKPVFVSKDAEYLVSPFPQMSINMGNDFEELLAAKGFTMRGPFGAIDEMVYNEKVNSSFILEIQIDLKPNYNVEFISHDKKYGSVAADILFNAKPVTVRTYTTKGSVSFGGNLVITALSPQYNEKIWKKSIPLENISSQFEGVTSWDGPPNMSEQLTKDSQVFNVVLETLEKVYSKALNLVWNQIDPEEMKIVTAQAKKADQKGN